MSLIVTTLWHHWTCICIFYSSTFIFRKVWNEITYPFPTFNSGTVDVKVWTSNFIPHFTGHVITYPCWAKSRFYFQKFKAIHTYNLTHTGRYIIHMWKKFLKTGLYNWSSATIVCYRPRQQYAVKLSWIMHNGSKKETPLSLATRSVG